MFAHRPIFVNDNNISGKPFKMRYKRLINNQTLDNQNLEFRQTNDLVKVSFN